MVDEKTRRAQRAMRGCDRFLSGKRPLTLAERLAELPGSYDLDTMPDTYGEGGPVETLEHRVAELFGAEQALFFPTGTMAQQVALRCWSEAAGGGGAVAMHPLAHPEVHEQHAYSVLTGLHSVWPTRANRLPTAQEVRECEEPFDSILLELPLRDAGFVLPTWDELVDVVAAARDRGAAVHVDGARIWETTVHFGRTTDEVAGLADSVYTSFYKTIGGISGAALAGPADFVGAAKAWRHRYGGQLFQHWPAALAALTGLETVLPRLDSYIAHAKVVAAALAEVPGARVHPAPPHTHQFQLWLPYSVDALTEAGLRLAEEKRTWLFGGWQDRGVPGLSMCEVTVLESALDWPATEITDAVTALVADVRE